jgi:hypothetical protein
MDDVSDEAADSRGCVRLRDRLLLRRAVGRGERLGRALVDVVATVEGRSTQIGSIEAHSQGQGTVYPRGESGAVRLTFAAGDKPVTSEQPIYFEEGYRVIVTVSPQLQLSTRAEIGRY